MKRIFLIIIVLMPLCLAAQNSVYVQVDYMKPLEGMSADYVTMEQKIYKPIHQERIKSGEILEWHLYEVRYPSGSDTEYDYVTVTVFGDFGSMDDNVEEYASIVARAQPDMTLEEVEAAAANTRNLIRSEVFKSMDFLNGTDTAPPNSLLVDYMKVLPTNEQEYLKMEERIWKPLHEARMEAGSIVSWGLYELLFPGGLNHPYSHATVTGFSSWRQIADSWPDDIWKMVHPNASQSDLEVSAHGTRDLVSSQIWRIVDFAVAAK